ncbi:hypothetical protein Cgig2_014901 [Carnegiea gigantea]|uniref:Uncharacterized protein n=1 Tax=Carnegiea gigantea TaxID=171969 RepID=A0A9Q1JIV4_9CARY|nr:hypothetical protein Cgig2_014901 [Carnegiea gigantea]
MEVENRFNPNFATKRYEVRKRDKKTTIARDLEYEITQFNRNDYVDDKEEDAQLIHARYQSLEQHRTWWPTTTFFTIICTPAARLRVVEIELEKDRTRIKQSKVNSSWLKAARNKMSKAFGSWVIDTNVLFTVVDSVYTNPLLETIREVGPYIRAPSSYALLDVYLPEADISLIPNTYIDKVKIGKTGR